MSSTDQGTLNALNLMLSRLEDQEKEAWCRVGDITFQHNELLGNIEKHEELIRKYALNETYTGATLNWAISRKNELISALYKLNEDRLQVDKKLAEAKAACQELSREKYKLERLRETIQARLTAQFARREQKATDETANNLFFKARRANNKA